MKLKSIGIALTPDWARKTQGEYTATAEIEGGGYGDTIKIKVDPEHCARIVLILEEAVAQAMARAAAEFREEVQARLAGPAIEPEKLEG